LAKGVSLLKAIIYHGPEDVRLEDWAKPEINDNEVLVRVKVFAVCGSDVRTIRKGSSQAKPPVIMGHEFAGDIAEVGRNVEGLKTGDRAASIPWVFCGKCYYCRSGRYDLCENFNVFGHNLNGAFAEFVKIPEEVIARRGIIKISDLISYEEAALAEPLSCCLNGVLHSNVKVGNNVVVMGAGPIGLFHVQLCRLVGASKIISVDLIEKRLNCARELGADATINIRKENLAEKIRVFTDGRGADTVIVAVGKVEAIKQGIEVLGRGGTLNIFGGVPPDSTLTIDPNWVHRKQTIITGSVNATPAIYENAMNLIEAGRIKVKPLIDRKFKIEEFMKAVDITETGECLKAFIRL